MSTLALQLAQLPALLQFQALGRLDRVPLAPVYCRCPSCGALQAAQDAISCGICGADVSELAPVAVVLA